MEPILTLQQICKSYGKHQVLKDISLHIPKGSIYGLIGKNGAGKTTLMRIIAGLQEASSGSFSRGKNRIGALINTPALYNDLTAYQNLRAHFISMGLTSYDKIPEILDMVGLSDAGNKTVSKFALGKRQRLVIAIALSGEPDIILLDEPINGLMPLSIKGESLKKSPPWISSVILPTPIRLYFQMWRKSSEDWIWKGSDILSKVIRSFGSNRRSRF